MRRSDSCSQRTSSQASRQSAGSDSNGSPQNETSRPDVDEDTINARSQQIPAQRPNFPLIGTFHPINRVPPRVQAPNASVTAVVTSANLDNVAPTATAGPTDETLQSRLPSDSRFDTERLEMRRQATSRRAQASDNPFSTDTASADIAEGGGENVDEMEQVHQGTIDASAVQAEEMLEVLTDEESDDIDPYESDAPESHSRWQVVTYGNAKCDICGEYKQPNVRMVRCKGTCAFQICERCEEQNGGRRHNTSQQYRCIKPNPRRQTSPRADATVASASRGQNTASGNDNLSRDNNNAPSHGHPTPNRPLSRWQRTYAQPDQQEMEFGIPVVYTQAHIRQRNQELAARSAMRNSSNSVNTPAVRPAGNQTAGAGNAQGFTQGRFHPYRSAYSIPEAVRQGMRGDPGTSQAQVPVRRQGPRQDRGQLFPRDARPGNGGAGNTASVRPNVASHELTALHALVRGAMRRFGDQPSPAPNATPQAILPTASSSRGTASQSTMARVKYTQGASFQTANAQRTPSQGTVSRDASGQSVMRRCAIPQNAGQQTSTSPNAMPQSRGNRSATSGNAMPRTLISQDVLRQEDSGYVADTSSYMQTGPAQVASSGRARVSGEQNPSRSVSPEMHDSTVCPSVVSAESDGSEEHPLMSEYQQRQQRSTGPQNEDAERAEQLGLNLQNNQDRAWWYLVLAANEEHDRLQAEQSRQQTTSTETEHVRSDHANTSQSARTEQNLTASGPITKDLPRLDRAEREPQTRTSRSSNVSPTSARQTAPSHQAQQVRVAGTRPASTIQGSTRRPGNASSRTATSARSAPTEAEIDDETMEDVE